MIKNIIFDWSGTLIDDMEQVVKANNIVLKKFGAKPLTIEQYREQFTLPYINFYKRHIDVPLEKIEKAYIEAIDTIEHPKPFPGVKETLKALKKKGIKMTVLSSTPQHLTERDIKNYDLDFFDEVLASVRDKREAIHDLMQRNSLKKENTAFVGDMVHDIVAGKHAGLKTVAICWGYQSTEKLITAKPDFIIDNIKEILNIIS